MNVSKRIHARATWTVQHNPPALYLQIQQNILVVHGKFICVNTILFIRQPLMLLWFCCQNGLDTDRPNDDCTDANESAR